MLKATLLAVLAVPLALLLGDVLTELDVPGSRLGADPALAVIRELGSWSIRLLLLTLSVSSLRRVFGLPVLARYRRLVGLTAFGYVLLHFLGYLGLLAGFRWSAIEEDLVERSYITVGFAGLLLLVPLAVTSTRGWQRRLGRRWRHLHRLVYAVAVLGLLHHLWLVKDGFLEPVLYWSWFALLMVERARYWMAGRATGIRPWRPG